MAGPVVLVPQGAGVELREGCGLEVTGGLAAVSVLVMHVGEWAGW